MMSPVTPLRQISEPHKLPAKHCPESHPITQAVMDFVALAAWSKISKIRIAHSPVGVTYLPRLSRLSPLLKFDDVIHRFLLRWPLR